MPTNAKNIAELLNTDTTVKVGDIEDGSVTTAKLAASAVTTAKVADNAITSAKALNLGRRNILYNGAMKIAQRGDVTNLTNGYTGCDRWKFDRSGSSAVVTGKQTGSGNMPQNGFPNAVHIDVTTADSSAAAGDLVLLRQYIESQDLQHLKFGTSSAESLTLSFWVKSSKTGTHWVEIYLYDANKVNSASYTVSSANTWEHKTLTFAGETSTAIPNDSTHGMVVQWWLKAGSTYAGGTHPGNVWHLTSANRVPGQVNVMDSTDNNFYLTGVQLETGSAATDFEHLHNSEELMLCRRYYQINYTSWYGVAAAAGYYVSDTISYVPPMRANPAIAQTSFVSGSGGRFTAGNTGATSSTIQGTTIYSNPTSSGGNSGYNATYSADAEL